MATPEVKVRLSAEGVQEVVAAFRQVQRESAQAGSKSAQAFKIAQGGLGQFKTVLATLGAGAIVRQVTEAVRSTLDWADALDDAASALGVTTDFLQEMRYAAVAAGTPVEVLNQALGVLQEKIQASADAGEPLVSFTNGMAIATRDAAGQVRDAESVFLDLAGAFEQIDNATTRTGLAADVFGAKIGKKMVNLLNLGSDGLARLRAEAKASGDVIEESLIKKGGALNDELELLRTRLTVAFASGLLDFDTSSIESFSAALRDPALVANIQAIGQALSRVVRVAANNFPAVAALAAAVTGGTAGFMTAGPPGAAVGALGFGAVAFAGASGFQRSVRTLAARNRANQPPAPDTRRVITGTPINALGGGLVPRNPAEEAKARAEEEKRAAAAEKAAAAAEREAEARQRAREATDQFEAQLLEKAGQRHEAEMANMALELAQYEENLRARGDLDEAEIARRLAGAQRIEEQLVRFNDLQRDADATFSDMGLRRAEIQERVARGLISEQQGQAELARLEADRLVNLQGIADEMLRIAELSGNQEQIQAAQQLNAQLADLRVSADVAGRDVAALRKQFNDAAENEFANFFASIFDGTRSASQAFKDLVKGIEREFLGLIAKQLSKALFSSLLGGGASGGATGLLGFLGVQRAAEGGLITGPGTGTSDSIPALLSNGEFVVRAAAVAQPGNLEALRYMNSELNFPPVIRRGPGVRRFAAGGLVTAGSGGAAGTTVHQLQVDETTMRMTIGDYLTRYLASEKWRNRR